MIVSSLAYGFNRKMARTVFLAAFLMENAAPAQDARNGRVEIVVREAARVIGTKGFDIPAARQGDALGWPRLFGREPNPGGLRALFPGQELRRIVVIRYSATASGLTPERVRMALFELSRREIETPTGFINWSEMNTWSIDAQIEFSNGPKMRMLTDGSHTCLIDEAGRPWFFRISPVEYLSGYETPEKALHLDTTNWSRFRDFETTRKQKHQR